MGLQKPSSSNPHERILVIHTAFIGDIILATPFLAGLRQIYPNARIQFLTTAAGAEVLEPNPWKIDTVIFHKRSADSGVTGFLRKARELKSFRATLVFCLHRSFRSALLAKAAGGENWGFSQSAGALLFSRTVSHEEYAFEAQKNITMQ